MVRSILREVVATRRIPHVIWALGCVRKGRFRCLGDGMLISSPVAGCCATNSFIDNIVGNVVEIQHVLEDLIRWSDVALGVAKDQDVQRAAAVLRGAVLFPDHVRLQVVAVELKIGDPGTWAAARRTTSEIHKYWRVSRGKETAKLSVFTPTFTTRGQTHTGTVHLPKNMCHRADSQRHVKSSTGFWNASSLMHMTRRHSR